MFQKIKVRFALLTFVVSLVTVVGPALAQTSGQPADPSSYGMTSARFVATAAAVLGLIGVVVGALALARPASFFGTAAGLFGAIVAGLIAAAVGGLRVITAGGIGTGGGRAGAIVALVLGLIAVALAGLAIARSRRAVEQRS